MIADGRGWRVGWLALAALGPLGGCGGTVQVRILTAAEDCSRDFGSSTAAAKIETFLAAASALEQEVDATGARLVAACEDGLREAGLGGAGESITEPCEALGRWVLDESAAIGDAPRLGAVTPTCTPRRGDFAACVSRCELRYRPEDIQVALDEAGLLTAPQASPRCRASCETLHAISETCTAPVGLDAGTPSDARSVRLHAVLQHVARAAELGAHAERISLAARRLVLIAPVLPEAAATVSIRAVACVSAASSRVRESAERLEAIAGAARAARGSPGPVSSRNSFDGGGGRG